MFKISQGTKISTTIFDRSKIKLVLNLIRLRYIYISIYIYNGWVAHMGEARRIKEQKPPSAGN